MGSGFLVWSRPPASASPGNWLDMQILSFPPDLGTRGSGVGAGSLLETGLWVLLMQAV